MSFTSIRLGGDVDPAMLTSRWSTRDWRVLEPVMKPVDLAAQGWRITAPKGFSAVLQVARSMGPATVSQLVLSDGLAAISVFIEPLRFAPPRASPEGLARRGAINIYGTRIADFWLTALGEVPAGTLNNWPKPPNMCRWTRPNNNKPAKGTGVFSGALCKAITVSNLFSGASARPRWSRSWQ